jgi:transcriptional regulator with XRE-family HTH domain
MVMNMKRSYLRRCRIKKRISLTNLSKKVGITKSHLCNIESGRKNTSLEVANKLEDFFGIPQRELLKRDGEED